MRHRNMLVTFLILFLGGTLYAGDWQPDPGFRSLFNGKDLTGWCFRAKADKKSPKAGAVVEKFDGKTESSDNGRYSAKDGILTVNFPKGKDRLIARIDTVEEFPTDFILKLEFRASVNADSGIFIRKPQLQCRDYLVAGPYKDLKKYKPQDWNQIEIVVKGKAARCTCNGEVLEAAFAVPETGPIGLEGDRGQMEYRRIQIKPTAAQKKAEPKRNPVPAGFVADIGVKYVPKGDSAQELDIYYPEKRAEKPQPLLVWIHGGGWQGGSKAQPPYLSQLRRGYIVASIEYRFSQKAIFPAQIQDCQAAIRWLRAHAKKYNIDPDHVGVGGGSAGGHLAALVGTTGGKKVFPPIGGNEDQSDRVQAVCDVFGPSDFWTVVKQADEDKNVKSIFKWNKGDPYSKLIGAMLGQDKEKCDAVSPVHYVGKDCPPFLILHGDRDTLVPYAQSVELADLLAKAGVKVTLQRLPGAGHGGPAFGLPAVVRLTEAFFDKYLKGVDAKIEPLPDDQVTIRPGQSPKASK